MPGSEGYPPELTSAITEDAAALKTRERALYRSEDWQVLIDYAASHLAKVVVQTVKLVLNVTGTSLKRPSQQFLANHIVAVIR